MYRVMRIRQFRAPGIPLQDSRARVTFAPPHINYPFRLHVVRKLVIWLDLGYTH